MKHILLIDDDAFFIKTLSNYLKRFNYEVSTETNAESALKLIDQTTFDLVITDYKLPNSDGLTVIENLKKTILKFLLFLSQTTQTFVRL